MAHEPLLCRTMASFCLFAFYASPLKIGKYLIRQVENFSFQTTKHSLTSIINRQQNKFTLLGMEIILCADNCQEYRGNRQENPDRNRRTEKLKLLVSFLIGYISLTGFYDGQLTCTSMLQVDEHKQQLIYLFTYLFVARRMSPCILGE